MNKAIYNATKHIRRSPYQAIAAAGVLTITFFLISIFSLVVIGSEKMIRFFETRPQVTAFFKDEADNKVIDELRNKIKSLNGVAEIKFISKEKALEIYKEQNKNDPLLLEMVTADILPASLEVSVKSPEIIPQIASLMEKQEGVEEVVYQKDVIKTLTSFTRAVRIGGSIFISLLLLSSIITVMIIVGLKITNHKHEIEVMRLLGAGKVHIVAPFLYEGAFYGALGSFIGWGSSYICLLYSTPFIIKFLGSIPLLPVPFWFMLALLGAQVFLGISVGLFSALFASRRFLK